MKVAIAAFAKTIGFSDVKTRLAKSIGKENADAFYTLSVAAVRDVLQKTQEQNPDVCPHWALADEAAVGLEQWGSFPAIWTGEGGLGTRLYSVSSELLKTHDAVFLIGTDSPQISPKRLLQIVEMVAVNPSVNQLAGPASDGGFWLWGSREPLPRQVWESVTYSVDTTLEELVGKATKHVGHVHMTYRFQDVDEVADLKTLQETLEHRGKTLLPAQVRLREWLQANNPIFQE